MEADFYYETYLAYREFKKLCSQFDVIGHTLKIIRDLIKY